MTATSKSGGSRPKTSHNKYHVYEILVDIGEEATIDEIVREFAIRHGGEVLNRNTARARKSEFKKDMKEVEIFIIGTAYDEARLRISNALEFARREEAKREHRRYRNILIAT